MSKSPIMKHKNWWNKQIPRTIAVVIVDAFSLDNLLLTFIDAAKTNDCKNKNQQYCTYSTHFKLSFNWTRKIYIFKLHSELLSLPRLTSATISYMLYLWKAGCQVFPLCVCVHVCSLNRSSHYWRERQGGRSGAGGNIFSIWRPWEVRNGAIQAHNFYCWGRNHFKKKN